MRLQIGENQFELVDQLWLKHQVLRPDVRLIVREKIAQLEVLRDRRVLILLRDLDESGRIGVRPRGCLCTVPSLRARPASCRCSRVPTRPFFFALNGSMEMRLKFGDRPHRVSDGQEHIPDAGSLGRGGRFAALRVLQRAAGGSVSGVIAFGAGWMDALSFPLAPRAFFRMRSLSALSVASVK